MCAQLPTPEDVLVVSRYSRFTSNPLRIGERGLWGGAPFEGRPGRERQQLTQHPAPGNRNR